jgi:hypothetical protein
MATPTATTTLGQSVVGGELSMLCFSLSPDSLSKAIPIEVESLANELE